MHLFDVRTRSTRRYIANRCLIARTNIVVLARVSGNFNRQLNNCETINEMPYVTIEVLNTKELHAISSTGITPAERLAVHRTSIDCRTISGSRASTTNSRLRISCTIKHDIHTLIQEYEIIVILTVLVASRSCQRSELSSCLRNCRSNTGNRTHLPTRFTCIIATFVHEVKLLTSNFIEAAESFTRNLRNT